LLRAKLVPLIGEEMVMPAAPLMPIAVSAVRVTEPLPVPGVKLKSEEVAVLKIAPAPRIPDPPTEMGSPAIVVGPL